MALCNTDPKKRQSDTVKVIISRRLNVRGFVDILLIWVDSEVSPINLFTGMATLKLLLNVFKFGGVYFWSITNAMLILFPPSFPSFVVVLFGREDKEVGLVQVCAI